MSRVDVPILGVCDEALQERDDWQKMTHQEIANLKAKGMKINSPDPKLFRDRAARDDPLQGYEKQVRR